MSLNALLADPADPRDLLDWNAHGCQVNTVSLADLLAKYEAVGFLYAAKRDRLAPYMSAVEETWDRALSAGDDLRRVITFESDDGRRWGSVDTWRSGYGTWTVQHLVANGGGVGSRASILTAIARCYADIDFVAFESWFRPSNPFPNRVLGGSAHALGEQQSARADYEYVAVPPSAIPSSPVESREVTEATSELLDLAERGRGQVYVVGAGLAEDIGMNAVDGRYRLVGLRRYRRTWLARDRRGKYVGAAIAHRGPLGLNFSFLENRCDLVLDPGLAENQAAEVAAALLRTASEAYEDFLPGFVPVVVPEAYAAQVLALGGYRLQTYAQITWLRPGLPRLASFFDAVIRPGGHRLLRAPA